MGRVWEHMVDRPVAAAVPAHRRDLVRLFLEHGFAGFPVVKEGSRKLVGVVTRQDLLDQPDEQQVALLMNPNPATTYSEGSLEEAARIVLTHRLHLLPVVTGSNDLVGLLTPHEFLPALQRRRGLVGGFLHRRLVPVHRATPARVALEILRTTHAGALPVLDDDGLLCGIVTDGDLLARSRFGEALVRTTAGLAAEGDAWTWEGLRGETASHRSAARLDAPPVPVDQVMVRSVHTLGPHATVREAAQLLYDRRLNQAPIVDAEGHVLDLLADLDLVRALFP